MPPNRYLKNKLPTPLPEGLILTDTSRKCWRLGKAIGQGGFGLIYLASSDCDKPVTEDALHVIKVENHQNGPLFCELKFYQRAVKEEEMKIWINKHRLDYLGIPKYWGSGEVTHLSTSYRFMVIDRLGVDLQKLLVSNGGTFPLRTVMQLGIRLLDILEFIHEQEYAHGDIKAANVLLHYTDPSKVYLADYGLSYRYCPNGNHKEYKENPRKGPNGTIEFTSLDAHRGVVLSRRGDLQILAFCMLHWLCGKLPWDQNLKDPTAVHTSKKKLLDELPESVIEWTAGVDGCHEIATFMSDINCLAYTEKPNYGALKKILLKGLVFTGNNLDAPLTFSLFKSILKDPKTVKHTRNAQQIKPSFNSPVEDKKGTKPTEPPNSPKVSKKINAAGMNILKDDINYINNGSNGQPCALQKRLPRDLSSQETANVKVSQKYTFTKTKQAVRFPNVVHDDHSSQVQLENHHKDREDIYKYSLIIPVLLILIFIVLYFF